MSTLVYCIYCIALFYTARGASVDIVRDTLGDVLTTKACVREICDQYGGKCIDRNRCQCRADRTTYLRYYQRCMPNYNLTTTLNRSEGCSYRLVANGYHDDRPRGRIPCIFDKLSLRALDLSASGSQLIDVCGIFTWSISSCTVMSSACYNDGYWKDMGYAGSNQTTFKIVKQLGVALLLQWNATLPQRYHGYILSLDVRCQRKFNRSDVTSYLLFKVKSSARDQYNTTVFSTSTHLPENTTDTPTIAMNKVPQLPESRDSTMVIVVGVVCGLFAVALIVILVYCLKKRKILIFKYWKKKKENKQQAVAMTARPMYDMNEYQSVNEHEPPVYTAPNRPGYQDLIVTPSTYQPLVAKTSTSSPLDSPFYYTLEEPGNQSNDVNTHIYHVVEGPS